MGLQVKPTFVLAVLVAVVAGQAVLAQQVTVATPYNALSEGFFENAGTSWGLRGPNWNLSVFGSPLQAAPAFGGFDPSAGLNFNTGFRRDGLSGYFGMNYSQGFRRSMISQTPVVTLQNGYPGAVYDTSTSPFVIGSIPVVGSFPFSSPTPPPTMWSSPGYAPGRMNPGVVYGNPAVQQRLQAIQPQREQSTQPMGAIAPGTATPADAPLRRRPLPVPKANNNLELVSDASAPGSSRQNNPLTNGQSDVSSAARPAPSVAEAKRMHQAEKQQQSQEALTLIERGRNAEATGKKNVAKVYYQMAYRRATGELKAEVLKRLQSLDSSP